MKNNTLGIEIQKSLVRKKSNESTNSNFSSVSHNSNNSFNNSFNSNNSQRSSLFSNNSFHSMNNESLLNRNNFNNIMPGSLNLNSGYPQGNNFIPVDNQISNKNILIEMPNFKNNSNFNFNMINQNYPIKHNEINQINNLVNNLNNYPYGVLYNQNQMINQFYSKSVENSPNMNMRSVDYLNGNKIRTYQNNKNKQK